MRRIGFLSVLVVVGLALNSAVARAGVFAIPHFVTPGEFAIGLEPELTLTNGAGLAANLKYTHGITELTNLTGIIGTGDGPRRFRFGGAMTFDFFPDLQGQPGIGIATQALYVRLPLDIGQLELTGIPYIHKSFATQGGELDPFLAVPFGMSFAEGHYKAITQVAFGAMFKGTEHLRYVLEFGIAVNNTQSYLSGGLVYYH